MKQQLWERYQRDLCVCKDIDLSLDISRMRYSDAFMSDMANPMAKALVEMDELEGGSIANADEGRMVGHYWLRAPKLAPTAKLRDDIEKTLVKIRKFAHDIHTGVILSSDGRLFETLLVIGIGGSALGPQWIASALGDSASDKMTVNFIDNTDPEGIVQTLQDIKKLTRCLVLVISKSGTTPETRNGMLLAQDHFAQNGVDFSKHAVAITGDDSELYKTAKAQAWLEIFPMWSWVGGRTSEFSAVGLVPAALQGIDIDAMIAGAAACDSHTRKHEIRENPAALMALMWHFAGNGHGQKDFVVLPYKDKLLLFSRYLQQLIMESLGKSHDRSGNVVHQGLSVYGNKGSTDQHAYVQQLRDGLNNFFACFIDVIEYGAKTPDVEPGVKAGDFLHGFFLGTREALYDGGRDSMTISIRRIDARSIGALIALFERAVGLYASLIDVNAYHQPGVEAGKKAATRVLDIQNACLKTLKAGQRGDATKIAQDIGQADEAETVYHILNYLAVNQRIQVTSHDVDDFKREFYS